MHHFRLCAHILRMSLLYILLAMLGKCLHVSQRLSCNMHVSSLPAVLKASADAGEVQTPLLLKFATAAPDITFLAGQPAACSLQSCSLQSCSLQPPVLCCSLQPAAESPYRACMSKLLVVGAKPHAARLG